MKYLLTITTGLSTETCLNLNCTFTDLNAVLFQCIKFLSTLRVKGKPVPANILIIDVNTACVWLYRSAPYLADIEKLYSGGASKDNSGFIGGNAEKVLHYGPVDKITHSRDACGILEEKQRR